MATGIYPPGSSIPYPYPRKKIIPATIPIPVCGTKSFPYPYPSGKINPMGNPYPIRYPLCTY